MPPRATSTPASSRRCSPTPTTRHPLPKSTGKEHFNAAALDRLLAERGRDLDTDVVATVTELTARVVAADVDRHGVERVVASGGGVANPVLWRRMQALTPEVEWSTSDTLGVPSDAKEAFAFALIGYLSAHRLPGNVPSCTGARGPRGWHPPPVPPSTRPSCPRRRASSSPEPPGLPGDHHARGMGPHWLADRAGGIIGA